MKIGKKHAGNDGTIFLEGEQLHAADLLSNRARLTPNREALLVLETGLRFTYAELNSRANRLANFLSERFGVGEGDRVSILAHNSVVYVDLLYAVAKIGAIFAPLNWRLVARELAYIVNDCEPKVLICGPEFVPLVNEMRADIRVEHYLALDGAGIDGAASYEGELDNASEVEPERPFLNGDSPYCILYTSGTTGRPKGAVIPHRQVIWNSINTAVSWGLGESDVAPIFTPMFHAGGLFVSLTPLFFLGGRIVLAKEFDPDESIQTITDEKCTMVLAVPTLFQLWMSSPLFDSADFSHVRFFISGGAPCPVDLIDLWRTRKGVVFRQGYGLTEVGTNCFSMTDEESVRKTGAVGKPIFQSQMRLVDEAGNEVPIGDTGELIIKGPHVCSGYWRNPEATAKAIRDGWFYTGDMASMDEEGFFTIIGRFKDMIISGGENVYAAEVEAVFLEHDAVAECALIGTPDDKWGEVGLMIVVLEPESVTTEEDLREFCQGKLARYKIPKRVEFTDALPYSPYGKVEKVKLKEKFVG
jgi:fatty-acyl-CoA synthase